MTAGCVTMKRRMTDFDFHRRRATLRKLELLLILYYLVLVPLVIYWHGEAARRWRDNWVTVLAIVGSAFVAAGVSIAWRYWPLSPKDEQRLRARLRRKYPNECVRCGYNISRSPGPNCPECGDALGDPEEQKASSTGGDDRRG